MRSLNLILPPKDELMETLFSNRQINPDTNCWEWTKSKNRGGYGQFMIKKCPGTYSCVRVHRVAAYIWLDFDINSDLHVLHRCDNPPCFNPAHLFTGTHADNLRDAKLKGRMINGGQKKVLDEEQVYKVLDRLDKGDKGIHIAKSFGVNSRIIANIKTGRTYTCWTDGKIVPKSYKLTESDVRIIKALLLVGRKQCEIADSFNIHYSMVSRIHTGNRRQDVKLQGTANERAAKNL